jgi:hypothetical protein
VNAVNAIRLLPYNSLPTFFRLPLLLYGECLSSFFLSFFLHFVIFGIPHAFYGKICVHITGGPHIVAGAGGVFERGRTSGTLLEYAASAFIVPWAVDRNRLSLVTAA